MAGEGPPRSARLALTALCAVLFLTFLDNTVQVNTGTVRLRANMPNEDLFFWPGQFVNVRLILTTRKEAVLIPLPAQQVGQQRRQRQRRR